MKLIEKLNKIYLEIDEEFEKDGITIVCKCAENPTENDREACRCCIYNTDKNKCNSPFLCSSYDRMDNENVIFERI